MTLENAPSDRLAQAMAVYLQHRADGSRASVDEVLAQHASLRDILEPLLKSEAESSASAPQWTIGDFVCRREIGRGGMGVVYEAWQRSRSRLVALKILPEHLGLVGARVTRFLREAELAARLDHPGIVEVYEVVRDGERYGFAMELVAGAPLDRVCLALAGRSPEQLTGRDLLAAVVADGQVPASAPEADAASGVAGWIPAVVDVVIRVADALGAAHRAGVIHRDVKPANILLRPDGAALITDFGLAHVEGLPSITVTGEFAGTPYYVSPEQAMCKRVPVDHRTDVFSLGVVLYELLTLARPFPGDTSHEVLARILTKEPADPRRRNAQITAPLAAIVLKALEKDPDQRYQSAEALRDDLRAFLAFRPITVRRPAWPTRLRRFCRREPWKAALAVLVLVGVPLVTGLASYALARQDEIRAGRNEIARAEVDTAFERALLAQSFDSAQALRAFADVLELSPGNVEAMAGTALVRAHANGVSDGLAYLDRCDADQPGDATLARARSHLQRVGKYQRKEVYLRSSTPAAADPSDADLGEPTAAFDLFLEALPPFPALTNGVWNVAPAGTWDWRHSVELLERAIARSKAARPLFHFALAQAAFGAADEGAARRVAEAIESLWPSSASAWFWCGFALEKCDRERAIAAYRRALALDPQQCEVHYRLGYALMKAERLAEAVTELQAAAVPPHWGMYPVLGFALRKLGDAGALAAFVDRWQSDAWNDGPGLTMLDSFAEDQVDAARRVRIARRAVELTPGDVDAMDLLAGALRDDGDAAAAATVAQQGLAILAQSAAQPEDVLADLRRIAAGGGSATEPAPAAAASPHDPPK